MKIPDGMSTKTWFLRIQTEQDHLLRHFDANICVNHWGTFVQQDMRWEGMTFHKLTRRVHCHCYNWVGYFATAWLMNRLLRCKHKEFMGNLVLRFDVKALVEANMALICSMKSADCTQDTWDQCIWTCDLVLRVLPFRREQNWFTIGLNYL